MPIYDKPVHGLMRDMVADLHLENSLIIARLDKLSRNEDVQAKLAAPDGRWDLIICDEAHKMSATSFGGELK